MLPSSAIRYDYPNVMSRLSSFQPEGVRRNSSAYAPTSASVGTESVFVTN